MGRRGRSLGILGLAVVLGLAGCQGEKEAPAPVDAGQPEAKADQQDTIEGVPEGYMNPLTMSQRIHDPVKLNQKMNEVAAELKAEDAPEYAKKMVDHLKQVAALIDENLKDCDGVKDALEAYFEKNKEEIVRLHKEGNEQEAKMDQDARSKVQIQTMLLMGPIAKTLAQTLARFQIKCPTQAQEVADLLQTVVGN